MIEHRWIRYGLFAAAAVGSALAFSGSAVAQVIVLQSTVANYQVGKTLAKTTQVAVPEGGNLVVVLANGATKTITGPFSGKVSDLSKGTTSNAALFNAVKKFVKTGGSSTKKVGALRSVAPGANDDASMPKFSWTAIPVNARGDVCLDKSGTISIARGAPGKEQTVTVVDLQSSGRAKVQFADGATTVDWPAELQLKNSAYALLTDGDTKRIRLRLISPVPGLDRTLQVLHGQRCGMQFESFLRGFAVTQR